MNNILFVLIFIFISLNAPFAQNKKNPFTIGGELPIAIGFNYERITDVYDKGDIYYSKGVTANYSTRRDRYAIDVLYSLSKRLNTESGLGISIYNSDLNMGTVMNPKTIEIAIKRVNVVISQKIMCDLFYTSCFEFYRNLRVPCLDFLKYRLSPYIELEYEQFLPKWKHLKGHSDLFSEDANYDISKLDIPAVSAETKTPIGILSVIGGLSFEAILYKKIGASWDFGYFHSLLGRSQIDVKYRYQDNEVVILNLKSENSGFMGKVRLRYYF